MHSVGSRHAGVHAKAGAQSAGKASHARVAGPEGAARCPTLRLPNDIPGRSCCARAVRPSGPPAGFELVAVPHARRGARDTAAAESRQPVLVVDRRRGGPTQRQERASEMRTRGHNRRQPLIRIRPCASVTVDARLTRSDARLTRVDPCLTRPNARCCRSQACFSRPHPAFSRFARSLHSRRAPLLSPARSLHSRRSSLRSIEGSLRSF